MYIIGLTGGIGTGKTEALNILCGFGGSTIEADLLAHQLYAPGQNAWHDIVSTFGRSILTTKQQINRYKLGEIVFTDTEKLRKLNQIVHPRMLLLLKELINLHKMSGTRFLVIEAAILVEAGWDEIVDSVWGIEASKEAVIDRLEKKKKLTRLQIAQRITTQISETERRKSADVVIKNNGTKSELASQIAQLLIAKNHKQE